MIIPILRKQRCRVSQNSIEMALAGGGLQVIMREKRVRRLSWSLAGFLVSLVSSLRGGRSSLLFFSCHLPAWSSEPAAVVTKHIFIDETIIGKMLGVDSSIKHRSIHSNQFY